MKTINIAIDGYAACGKSSTAKQVAENLSYLYIDSGAMYRAFTLYLIQQKIDPQNHDAVIEALSNADISFQKLNNSNIYSVCLNQVPVDHAIRAMSVNALVSEVSALRPVRYHMVKLQQKLGENKGIVMDGRDIGTVVFPDAELKVFMRAPLGIRVLRRQAELRESGIEASYQQVKLDLLRRDFLDTTRKESPLKQAPDAKVLDTGNLDFEQQVKIVVNWAKSIAHSID